MSDGNANRLRNGLGDFIAYGRNVGGRRARKSTSSGKVDTKAIRKWAKANGIDVNSRGGIPAEVVERYKVAATEWSAADRAGEQLPEFAEPEHYAAHRDADEPLIPTQWHGAEGCVEEPDVDHGNLEDGGECDGAP